jgi:formylglycine-generating enzyme required for sulfatase activity
MRHKSYLFLLLLWLFTTISYSQHRDFYGVEVDEESCDIEDYMNDEQVQDLVNRILEVAVGFGSSYIHQPCPSVVNCIAVVDEVGRPGIQYNPNFFNRIKEWGGIPTETQAFSDWNVLHILAHEVAHHLRNHLTNPPRDKTLRDLELEADETAGYLLYMLGAPSLAVAQQVLESSLVSENGSSIHPPRSQRLNSFRMGWNRAEERFPKISSAPVNPASGLDRNIPTTYSDTSAGSFVLVQGGTFDIGCMSGQPDCLRHVGPIHQVNLSSYYIGQYEVTQEQWQAVMGNNPSYFNDCDHCPVEMVSWEDVQDFICRLNEVTGQSYRLPTEAEWEFAARGGNKSRRYQYPYDINPDNFAWYKTNSSNQTHPVGQKRANKLGLYDMIGNVFEWCQDWWGNCSSYALTCPRVPTNGYCCVDCGGSWFFGSQYCHVGHRGSIEPDNRIYLRGFRLARTP